VRAGKYNYSNEEEFEGVIDAAIIDEMGGMNSFDIVRPAQQGQQGGQQGQGGQAQGAFI